MKILVTAPVKVVSSRTIRPLRRVQFKIASKRTLLRRFGCFIESTDWDQRFLCTQWIDKAFIGILVVFMIYFVPVFAPIFLR